MDDPYVILGLGKEASQDDIRRAYRALAKRHHPDLNPGNARAEEQFKKISAANELLSDADKRARFDRGEIDAAGQERSPPPSYRSYAEGSAGQRYGRPAGGWSKEDLGDMFGSIFGDARHPDTTPARGADERFGLTTRFLDAINGATRRLALPDGRTLDVKIPAGCEDGQILRLRGQGGPGFNDGPRGDALIEIHVASHPFFRRDGDDIRLDLPVSLSEAVLGGMVEIPTPAGAVRMQVPPHSDTGTELRLRNRGVPAHGGQPAGHLFARLRVTIGKPDPALENFLRGWKPAHPDNPREAMEGEP